MKLAISTAVGCLLLIGGNGVRGATSLRRRTNEENERELIGLGLFWGRVPTYRPTPEPTQQSDSPTSEPTPPKYVSYFDYGQNTYPQVSQPKPYGYPEVSHNPYGHPVVYYDPYGYPVVPRTGTVKPTPFATVKPTLFPTPLPTTPRTPWPTCAPTEKVTLAKVICDPNNRSTFLGFCVVLQATGFDIILNDFQELDEEYQLLDDFDELAELLIQCELSNMLGLFFSPNEIGDLIGEFSSEPLGTKAPDIFTVVPGTDAPETEAPSESPTTAPSESPTTAPTPPPGDGDLPLVADTPAPPEMFAPAPNPLVDEEARKINVEAFITTFLDENYNVDVNGGFGEFLTNFQDSADNDQVFTVFVPTNEAMAALQMDIQNFANPQEILADFGAFHVFVSDKALEYDDINCDKTITMSNGEITTTSCKKNSFGNEKKFQIGNANADTKPQIKTKYKDIFADNGIIQVIGGAVLRPFPITESPSEAPSVTP